MQDDQVNQQTTGDLNASDELTAAYNQTISTTSPVVNVDGSGLSDEKQKINSLIAGINSSLDSKKTVVEKKLNDLKTLKAEIEAGLEDLKKAESKKDTLQAELEKIEKIEAEQKQIESEVANMSSGI